MQYCINTYRWKRHAKIKIGAAEPMNFKRLRVWSEHIDPDSNSDSPWTPAERELFPS